MSIDQNNQLNQYESDKVEFSVGGVSIKGFGPEGIKVAFCGLVAFLVIFSAAFVFGFGEIIVEIWK